VYAFVPAGTSFAKIAESMPPLSAKAALPSLLVSSTNFFSAL